MKGLLLKDFYNIESYRKQYLIITGCMLVYGIAMKSMTFTAIYILIVCGMQVITCLGIDEQAHFNGYAMTMPITKKDFVKSKYIMLVIMSAIGCIIGTALGGIQCIWGGPGAGEDTWSTVFSVTPLFIAVYCIVLPMAFKLGVEKARMLYLGVMVALFVLVMVLAKGVEALQIDTLSLSGYGIAAALVIFMAVAVVISYRIAVKIVQTKEW